MSEENRLPEDLLQRIERLEGQMRQQAARTQVTELMNRYSFYTAAGQGPRIVDELWAHKEAVSIEYGASGTYEELWRVQTYYCKDSLPGRMTTLSFSSPVLEFDADGRHARGVWHAFCTETDAGDLGAAVPAESDSRRYLLSSQTADGKRYRAEILLQNYEVSFVQEEGAWRICRLHVQELFRCPYDRDWVQFAQERFASDGMWLEALFETPMELPPQAHGENLPSGQSSRHWQYTTDRPASPVDFVSRQRPDAERNGENL